MSYNITPNQLSNKLIDELTLEEMMFVHLDTGYTSILVKKAQLRSTLSFIYQNIQHALQNENSKHLMPYLSLCAVLDQLGICYDRKNQKPLKFKNGLKRCLVNFGGVDEDDKIIDVLYALRNGLLHNVSLTSFDEHKKKYYRFRYSKDIATVYQDPQIEWDGNYLTLDSSSEKSTTLINVERFRDLVYKCIETAAHLNQNSQLELRLKGGVRQLFYDYIRAARMS